MHFLADWRLFLFSHGQEPQVIGNEHTQDRWQRLGCVTLVLKVRTTFTRRTRGNALIPEQYANRRVLRPETPQAGDPGCNLKQSSV